MVLLFLHSGETNELPILYLQYWLKLRGFKTLNIGQNISADQLAIITRHIQPSYLITYLGKKQNYSDLTSFVKSLRSSAEATLFISIENDLNLGIESPWYLHLSRVSDVVEFMNEKIN